MPLLRQSLTSLLRRPFLSLGIITTLGLALAATLLVLGLLNTYLLQPLPYGNGDRVVAINEYPLAAGPASLWRMTFGTAADVHDRATAFSRKAIVRNETFTVHTPGGAEVAFVQRVSPDFFGMLGLRAALGDIITPANADQGGELALVLSHEFWQRRFGGDRGVVGRSLRLDDRSYRIVGVMPAGLALPLIGEGQQAWVALRPANFIRQDRVARRHFMFGELAPGRTLAAARGELAALARTLAREFPATNADRGLTATSLREALVGTFRRQLLLLQAAVALLLVVACVNAGGLLVAQAIRRRREFAIRLALGAATRDLFRQFFLESLWLTLVGAALGLALAGWVAPLTVRLLPAGAPLRQLPPPGVTLPIAAVAVGLAALIALAFGLVPLIQARRLKLEAALRDGARQIGSVAGGGASRVLVALQIAIALALLITAGQLVRSFRAVAQVDRGIPVDQLYTFRLGSRGAAHAGSAARYRYFQAVLDRLRELPHVAAAGFADFALVEVPGSYFGFVQENDGVPLSETPKRAARRFVSPGLLDALELRVAAGRWLTEADRADGPRVAVISQSLADRFWPAGDALGRRVQIEGTGDGWWEIVGVVSDILGHGSQPKVIDAFFLPATLQTPVDTGAFVRVRGPQPLTKDDLQRAIDAVDANNPYYFFYPVREFYAITAWQTRFGFTLVGVFAGLAIVLCLSGVYAVLAFAVAGRTAEFGIRLALGATRSQVARLVLCDAARMTLPGLALGTVLAWLLGRAVRNLLFQVSPLDPVGYAVAMLALAVACTAACLVPMFRATRIDPLKALRID